MDSGLVASVVTSLMASGLEVSVLFFSFFLGVVVTVMIYLVTSDIVVTVVFFWFFWA